MRMNLCQINFRGGTLDFDLLSSCSDCGWLPLIQLGAISLHLTDTKPNLDASGDGHFGGQRGDRMQSITPRKWTAFQIIIKHLFESQHF